METTDPRKPRVVLVPLPLQGHLTPMLQLGSILHSRGFSIIVAHPKFNSPNPENLPEFTLYPLTDGLAGFDPSSTSSPVVVSIVNENCRVPLEDCIKKLLELDGPVACIIHDYTVHCVKDVADHLKIPRLCLRSTTAAYMQSYEAILNLHEQKFFPLPDSQLQESVPGLHPLIRFKDLPISVTSVIPDIALEFGKIFSQTISSSEALIWNSVEMLDHSALHQLQQQYQIPFFPIGPFHKMAPSAHSTSLIEEDISCISWLDTQVPKSVLYVSLGSLATMGVKGLLAIAWGLANSGQPFLWVVRPSSVNGSKWIENLPEEFKEATRERGLVVKWAPQKKVLAHWAVGGFLSHCGWNSTLESLCKGVPIICKPWFADQMINARFLIHLWKVGVELENELDKSSIEKAVRVLMVDEGGNEMRQRAAELKDQLQLCTQKGGSSYKSLDELVVLINSFTV